MEKEVLIYTVTSNNRPITSTNHKVLHATYTQPSQLQSFAIKKDVSKSRDLLGARALTIHNTYSSNFFESCKLH